MSSLCLSCPNARLLATGPLPKKSPGGAVAAAVVSLVLVGVLATGCYVMKTKGMLAAAW